MAGCAVDQLRPRLRWYVAGREGLYRGRNRTTTSRGVARDRCKLVASRKKERKREGQGSEALFPASPHHPTPILICPDSKTHPPSPPFTLFCLHLQDSLRSSPSAQPSLTDHQSQSPPCLTPILQACPLMGSCHCSLPRARTRTRPALPCSPRSASASLPYLAWFLACQLPRLHCYEMGSSSLLPLTLAAQLRP